MKKLSALILILSSLALTGCGGCPGKSEDSCKSDDSCRAIYKPCSLSEEGCKNNLMFTECRTKSQK